MDRDAVLAAFDEQIRRQTVGSWPGQHVERDGGAVIRAVADDDGGWAGVLWSRLTTANADAVIAAQINHFARLGQAWEWKHYSYDQPADLPGRLTAAGLTREPDEALLVAEITDLPTHLPPPGVTLRPVSDQRGVDALVSVHDEVFGGVNEHIGEAVLAGLATEPRTMGAVLAVADGRPIAAGRVEFHHGAEFASLWGGGTVPAWRRQGVFRALVAHRARLAAAFGFRYLYLDASPQSEPTLCRLGFHRLATTTPFVHPVLN